MKKNHNQLAQTYDFVPSFGSAPLFRPEIMLWLLVAILAGCDFKQSTGPATSSSSTSGTPTCQKVVHADVVALDQVYFYNRFGAFNPAGMMYALRKDVVPVGDNDPEEVKGTPLGTDKAGSTGAEKDLKPGQVRLRSDKRPRPLVLRVNEGDCLHVKFTNLLSPAENGQDAVADPETAFAKAKDKRLANIIDSDEPATRHASIHVNGLDLVSQKEAKRHGVAIEAGIASEGANVGLNGWKDTDGRCATDPKDFGKNLCSLAAPGETREYLWYAKKEGGYLFYSMAAPAGGEGDGGQVGLGLFGSVNVQPKGATWYRSQVTHDDLIAANEDLGLTDFDQPKINYRANYKSGPYEGQPILRMLDDDNNIIYSDLNAVIDIDGEGDKNYCKEMGEGNSCGKPYREFTTIFHDELTVVQAFHELSEEDLPISALRDGHGINYGSAGLGAMVLANRQTTPPRGPTADCPECKLEEFFLTSWANGDPALVLGEDNNGQKHAMFPNDPSNVHHSYIGDPVRFRNMHAGPKETHVFHLHAHQWVQDKHDPNSLYLDSQTISPGAVFSYEIHYGGSGNRNLAPGDSIFHCHLYPHFAQGMWELWRSHDVFEDGSPGLYDAKNNKHGRNLPDYEIAEGTPNPAIVPLPRTPLPPMPSEKFRGYPFYIAGVPGHRPPQAPLDLDIDPNNPDKTTLERHLILGGTLKQAPEAPDKMTMDSASSECKTPNQSADLYGRGRKNSACIAGKVKQDAGANQGLYGLARELESARLKRLDINGTEEEKQAMKYHQGQLELPKHGKAKTSSDPGWKPTPYNWDAPGYSTVQCDSAGKCDKVVCNAEGKCEDALFRVNGRDPKPGAPYADPCPRYYFDAKKTPNNEVVTRDYRAAYVQFDMPVNKAGWHDPQARIAVLEEDIKGTLDGTRPAEPFFFRAKSGECIQFKATNLIPSNLNLDDFQVYSPTDVIGQHIHLVKFDVTSSDGSGNGWNYEDGTLAADEVRERIIAHNRWVKDCQAGKHKPEECSDLQILHPKTHPMFKAKGAMEGDSRGFCSDMTGNEHDDDDFINHPWCGAQTTTQRWWADPLLNKKPGEPGATDRTIRTVFTHDHFGPSSHQHHGLYAALVIEPSNSKWEYPDGTIMGGAEADGKPAIIVNSSTNLPHKDGGPTHYAANVIVKNKGKACVHFDPEKNPECVDSDDTLDPNKTVREFNLAFADYALVYDAKNKPVNPTNRVEGDLPVTSVQSSIPTPEGISTKDPGTQLINYRNEPIPLRIGKADTNGQYTQKSDFAAADGEGNMANVFSSKVHRSDKDNLSRLLFTEKEGRGSGDPATPILRAYDGDRVQIRLIQGAQEENHVFTLNGVKWLSQAGSENSGYANGQQIGISEHFEFNVRFDSPTPNLGTTDHLYSSSATDNLWDGQWGLLRTFAAGRPQKDTGVRAFPFSPKRSTDVSQNVCGTQKAIQIEVSAWRVADLAKDLRNNHKVDTASILPGDALPYNRNLGVQDPNAIIFVDEVDYEALINGKKKTIEPLILRAHAGDCINVTLYNKLPEIIQDGPSEKASWSYNQMPPISPGLNFNQVTLSNRVGLHPQLVAVNVAQHDGSNVGNNENSTVPAWKNGNTPPSNHIYEWYAGEFSVDDKGKPKRIPLELGVAALTDMGDVIKHGSHGAKGALIIEPQCSSWTEDKDSKASATVTYWEPIKKPGTDEFICGDPPKSDSNDKKNKVSCDAKDPKDRLCSFREFVLIYQDDVSSRRFGEPLPNLRNADDAEDTGQKAFNYGTEPIWGRVGAGPADDPGSMNEQMWANVFSSRAGNDSCSKEDQDKHQCTLDPATPVFTAEAGTPVRFRIVHPSGHPRNHAFTLFGHDWIMNPWQQGSSVMGWNKESSTRIGSTSGIGPMRHVNILASAGGCFKVPGDYLYRTQEGFMFGGGLWGIFRVKPEESPHKIPDTCWVASNRKD